MSKYISLLKFNKAVGHDGLHAHGGTTEEGNFSYHLPRAAAVGSNGSNKGQIRKVPVDEIA